MQLFFTKMHGLGNDYIYVNGFDERMPWLGAISDADLKQMIVRACHRHTGIGADGMIFILPSDSADCRMRMYNADGSRGAMCGNGIRCVARYVREHGLVASDAMKIETDSGIKDILVRMENGNIQSVRVDMGGAYDEGERRLMWHGRMIPARLVSMGNPHCVIFVDTVRDYPLLELGSHLQTFPEFMDGINVEVAAVGDAHHMVMRVYERGTGETMACGTGACAVCAAAVWQGYSRYDENMIIRQPGGQLVTTMLADDRVLMEGPAETICHGVCEVSFGENL